VLVNDCMAFDLNGDGTVTVDEILIGVNAALNGCPVDPVFPANYRDTYTEVRDCRFSTEHGGVYIRVLANPIAAQPYINLANPLPVGSIVIKEEYSSDPTCTVQDNLAQWRVMRKEAPGFDPVAGDWHWQWVDPDRSVRFNDKTTCIGCHTRPECLARDHMCTAGPAPGSMQSVLKGLPAALLSVSGTSATDVYAVGADPSTDDFGPYVLHYDGERWRRLNTHATGTLWWISVTPIDGAFYMSGEHGLILRYDLANATFDQQPTPGTETIYGIWGTAADNIWAVGGDPSAGVGVIWHFNGTAWSVDDVTGVVANGLPPLFKVWGRSENEVYAVGREGVILRFDGSKWSQLTSNTDDPLFTVHGNDTDVVAVGGVLENGDILELDGDTFTPRTPSGLPQMNGVFLPPSGSGVAVGVAGSLAGRIATGWEQRDSGLNTNLDFHAVWVDPEGGTWAVGGEIITNFNQGMLAYAGTRTIGTEVIDIPPCPTGVSGGPMTVSYTNDIVPLFTQAGCNASSCHGTVFPQSGLNLSTYDTSFGPGSEARSFKLCDIVPGSPDTSYLFEKLGAMPRFGQQMPQPPRQPLTAAEMDKIRTWILEGAQNDAAPTPTPSPTPVITPSSTPTGMGTGSCDTVGNICTVAGTGLAQFDGDGRPASQTSFYWPLLVSFDSADRPLILDYNNLRVRRLDLGNVVHTIMGTGTEDYPTDGALAINTPLHHASDIEMDNAGNMYVAGNHVPVVFRVSPDQHVLTVAGTKDVGYDGDGHPALQAKLNVPYGVLPSDDGGFYITDLGAHVVRYVNPAGIISTVAGTGVAGYSGDGKPGPQAQLYNPTRLAFGPDGSIYICDTGNNAIRRLTKDGIISTVVGTGELGYSGDRGVATRAQLNQPYDVRFSPAGDMYIADAENNVIRRVDRAGIITTVVGTRRDGFEGDGGPASQCKLNRPTGVTFDGDGTMWIADSYNERVRRVTKFLSLFE